MGWNRGYTIFEQTVIGAYDLGKLDKDLLSVLMEPYRDTDIDSGGSCNLESEDGKDVKQIVIETMGLKPPQKPTCAYDDDEDIWDAYHDDLFEVFSSVTKQFGWG